MLAANTLAPTQPATNTVTSSLYYNPTSSTSNRATIIVHVPANSKLIVDGKATNSTSDTRRFYSPPLEPGKNYHYDFKAVVERNGKPAEITRRVEVRAGESHEISLSPPDTEEAAEQGRERTSVPDKRVRSDSP
jgi:uncharacterized protein (TIGR03000 family)